jgi:hypothetical protein
VPGKAAWPNVAHLTTACLTAIIPKERSGVRNLRSVRRGAVDIEERFLASLGMTAVFVGMDTEFLAKNT